MSITVLMTTYNCGLYIGQAIKSILKQTFKNFELLIIDDGSTDNTEKIIKSFEDIRIKYEKIEHIGRSYALNYGLKNAKYDWIAIMDADDVSHPSRLEKQINFLNNNNNIVFTFSAYFRNGKVLFVIPINNDYSLNEEKFILHGHFSNSSSLIHKKIINEAGGFNQGLKAYVDYDLWLRINKKVNLVLVPEILHYVRMRNNSMSTTYPSDKKEIIYQIQNIYYEDFQEWTGINDEKKRNLIFGWREFFYGDKRLARHYWSKIITKKLNIKLLVAYLLSYLPSSYIYNIIDSRIRLRFEYHLNYKRRKMIQKEFNSILFNIDL